MLFHISSRLVPLTMLVAVIAPGLTSGFISEPPALLLDLNAMIELNACPVASTPIVFTIASGPAPR